MDVVLALERVRVLLGVINTLDLNGGVIKFVLSTAQIGHLGQCLKGLDRLDVTRHGHLAHGDSPHVQIVKVDDVAAACRLDVVLELLDVDVARGALHHDFDDVFDDRDRGEEDNEGEEVRAKGVSHPHVGEEVDDSGSNNDTDTHEHVTQNVKESSIDIDVANMLVLVFMSVAMAVTMAVTVVMVVVVVLSLVTLLVL